jgi:hypothetical protein
MGIARGKGISPYSKGAKALSGRDVSGGGEQVNGTLEMQVFMRKMPTSPYFIVYGCCEYFIYTAANLS